jgi:cytidylate kinase
MSVITISRQLGSLGTEIARGVAEKLNYQCMDKESIGNILADFDFGAPELEKFDEKRPPLFWDSLSFQRTKYLHSIQAAIYDCARKGQMVIVGRGGQVLLKDVPGTLHVRIFAPFDLRVKRLVGSERIDEKHAVRMLRQSDHDSAGYIQSFFHADWEDASLYDLLINTEKLLPATAIQLIIASVHSGEIQEGVEKGKEELAGLALVQRAEAKLMPILGSDLHQVEIRVENGVVFLRGAVLSPVFKEECERTVAAMEGVKDVKNELSVANYYTLFNGKI